MINQTEFYVAGVMKEVPEPIRHLGTASKCEQCGQDVIYHLPALQIAQAVSKERKTQLQVICQECYETHRQGNEMEVMVVTKSAIETSTEIDRIMADRQ